MRMKKSLIKLRTLKDSEYLFAFQRVDTDWHGEMYMRALPIFRDSKTEKTLEKHYL